MKIMIRLIFIFYTFFVFSQEKTLDKASNNLTVNGNVEFINEKLNEAESYYRQAISKDSTNIIASYNMANTFYRNGFDDEALNQYKESVDNAKDKNQLHKTLHNLGDVYMKKEDYENAMNSFKKALLNNPSDDETRYNYALAKELLKNQEKNKNEQKKQNKNDDQKNDDENQKNDKTDDKKDQNNEEKSEKDDNKNDKKNQKDQNSDKNKQPKPNQISPEQLKNLLKAMDNEEKKVQDKVNKSKVKGTPKKNKKDW